MKHQSIQSISCASFRYITRLILFSILFCVFSSVTTHAKECVILLHGLARTAGSMTQLTIDLAAEGFVVENIDYPSRDMAIEKLAPLAIEEGIDRCRNQGARRISFVTHSLGGILVRYYLKHNDIAELNRVVMLGPPNQGSEVVDTLKDVPGFKFINGPAGTQLGTKVSDIPKFLGTVDFELGIIAGKRSINLILSALLPNPDDGKVSVENTKVEGMTDFMTVPAAHPFLMKNERVISQVIHFLKFGKFDRGKP
ncbi:MAG: alpha/beta hydrolase [Desulfobacterales bacterium]